jgi:hypothetical protein
MGVDYKYMRGTIKMLKTPKERGAPIWPESRQMAGNTHITPDIPHIASKAAHPHFSEIIENTVFCNSKYQCVSKKEYSVSILVAYVAKTRLI